MKGYMYILKCANSKYYVGSTNDLQYRLWQHEHDEGAQYPKAHKPFKLVYVEEFDRIDEAFYREQQIKKWSRAKKEALISGNQDSLHEHSKCLNKTSHLNKPGS